MQHGTATVPVERLRLSRAPTADLAAAAIEAQKTAGLDQADFVVLAVEPGTVDLVELARVVDATVPA